LEEQFNQLEHQNFFRNQVLPRIAPRPETIPIKKIGEKARNAIFNRGDDADASPEARELRNDEEVDEHPQVKSIRVRADSFNRHFNDRMRDNQPMYREVQNVRNKNRIDDVKGLKFAYGRDTGIFVDNNTMYISGTGGKDGIGSKVNDVFSDIFLLPTHNTQFSQKYQDVVKELEKNPQVNRLVAYSLGSAVVQEINNRNNNKYVSTVYGSPFVNIRGNGGAKNPRHLRFRNKSDPISMLDRDAIQVDAHTNNPVKAHSFENMKTQGSYALADSNLVSSRGIRDSSLNQQNLNNSNEQK